MALVPYCTQILIRGTFEHIILSWDSQETWTIMVKVKLTFTHPGCVSRTKIPRCLPPSLLPPFSLCCWVISCTLLQQCLLSASVLLQLVHQCTNAKAPFLPPSVRTALIVCSFFIPWMVVFLLQQLTVMVEEAMYWVMDRFRELISGQDQ